MLIEQLAHANRWRPISPAAKAVFALCGLISAFAALTPLAGLAVALVLAAVALAGAGIKLSHYLRIAVPPLLFLAASGLPLLVSIETGDDGTRLALAASPADLQRLGEAGARTLGSLTALLFLVATTPLMDIIALLRRLRAPELLLDLMVLCYRTLFIFSACVSDMRTAQAARLGYGTPRLALRSLGDLAANLVAQVWQRSHALYLAALSRNNDGPLRFLESVHANALRDTGIATAAGVALIFLTRGMA